MDNPEINNYVGNIVSDILKIRDSQKGTNDLSQDRTDSIKLQVLDEVFVKIAKEVTFKDSHDLRTNLVHLAACAIAWCEALDKKNG